MFNKEADNTNNNNINNNKLHGNSMQKNMVTDMDMDVETDHNIIPPPMIGIDDYGNTNNNNITDAFTTPPMQSSQFFDKSKPINSTINKNTVITDKKYGDIQHFPTPLVFHNNSNKVNGERRYSNSNSLNSPTLGKERVFSMNDDDYQKNVNNNSNNGSSSTGSTGSGYSSNISNAENIPSSLRLCKVRQWKNNSNNTDNNNITRRNNIEMKNVLVDKNKFNNNNERYFSEYRPENNERISSISTMSSTNDERRSYNDNDNDTSQQLFRNIRPVDRVVSLPFNFQRNDQNKSLNEYMQLSESIPKSNVKLEEKDEEEEEEEKEEEEEEEPEEEQAQEQEQGTMNDDLPRVIELNSIDEPIHYQSWTIIKKIGEGSFSKVYLANDNETAIKITDIKYNKDGNYSEELQLRIKNSLIRELEILKILKHPNIIKLIGTDYDINNEKKIEVNKITMAIEYCKGGDLFDFIDKYRSKLSCELIQCIFANIVSALYYMHNLNICHRDIKLENLLLKFNPKLILSNGINKSKNHEPIIILSDFGLSKKIDNLNSMLSTRCGSEDYVSPELLLGMPYDGKQNDCWSLGVVLYTILENRLPFDPLPIENNNNKMKRNVKPAHRIAMISWSWYSLKDDVGEFNNPKRIVKKLLCKRSKRADILEIYNDPWCLPYVL
ncbi:hypothetical protein C6P40_000624 [Pichia californica]|uniref:non-specific serine/threonine protein kinase n=1 Tax=Pichia californica TaxID=460514 RepID=A0A9P6WK99_9ASCO|nr:hypothetical protein C6P42_002115 [[Candida] californica]KAG0688710.1 hypothetical protein C6P40_000624 [[Candida] californica]